MSGRWKELTLVVALALAVWVYSPFPSAEALRSRTGDVNAHLERYELNVYVLGVKSVLGDDHCLRVLLDNYADIDGGYAITQSSVGGFCRHWISTRRLEGALSQVRPESVRRYRMEARGER